MWLVWQYHRTDRSLVGQGQNWSCTLHTLVYSAAVIIMVDWQCVLFQIWYFHWLTIGAHLWGALAAFELGFCARGRRHLEYLGIYSYLVKRLRTSLTCNNATTITWLSIAAGIMQVSQFGSGYEPCGETGMKTWLEMWLGLALSERLYLRRN